MSNGAGLSRRLGTGDAVVIGLGSMIGAGVFAAFTPAARAAGAGLLIGLALAAGVAYCNATGLRAAGCPVPGVGRNLRLRPGTVGRLVGVPRRLGVRRRQDRQLRGDGADLRRLRRPDGLAATGRGGRGGRPDRRQLPGGDPHRGTDPGHRHRRAGSPGTRRRRRSSLAGRDRLSRSRGWSSPDGGPYAVLQSAGLLFFAFAGYARIATMGEEVRDPARTIPRAIPLALGIAVAVYAVVAVALLTSLGPAGSPARTSRWPTPSPGASGPGRCRSCGSARPRRRWARCWPSSPAWVARAWPWPARATCRGTSPRCTPASGCRTARS